MYIYRHRIICLSCVHRSLKLLNDSIFVPPAAIYSLFHGFSSIRTAVAPSLSLDQRHGTCSKTICVSRTCKPTVFVVHWRRFSSNSTRHIKRIRGVIFAMMRYINWYLHLHLHYSFFGLCVCSFINLGWNVPLLIHIWGWSVPLLIHFFGLECSFINSFLGCVPLLIWAGVFLY